MTIRDLYLSTWLKSRFKERITNIGNLFLSIYIVIKIFKYVFFASLYPYIIYWEYLAIGKVYHYYLLPPKLPIIITILKLNRHYIHCLDDNSFEKYSSFPDRYCFIPILCKIKSLFFKISVLLPLTHSRQTLSAIAVLCCVISRSTG